MCHRSSTFKVRQRHAGMNIDYALPLRPCRTCGNSSANPPSSTQEGIAKLKAIAQIFLLEFSAPE
jgi:hypothetical protein